MPGVGGVHAYRQARNRECRQIVAFIKASGRIMGIFDKVENEAEDMAQKDPNLAQQAGQLGGGQAGQDMQAAQNMVGQQRGSQDQNQGGYDQNQGDPNMSQGQGQGQQGGYDQNQDQNMGQDQNGGYDQSGGYNQDQNMDQNMAQDQQDGYEQDQDRGQNQGQDQDQNW
jgi:hypothetical protein